MNQTGNKTACENEIDASCRVPLLALFGGAALWLVLGLVLGIVAAMSFHKPDMFANCPFLTYGHTQAAANDLLLYGFVIPGALGVVLWIFARLSQAPLALPIVPVAAANLWHVGVLIGTIAILSGNSNGQAWLEYPRIASSLLFAGFMLVAVSAVATMGFRANREMYPSHWFLFAALLWFAWIYSTSNLFLASAHPPRGVVQAIIDWWFTNNALFVFLSLTGVGIVFYFLPKFMERPLASSAYVVFAFLTLMFFGTWMGVPPGSPVPAWLPTMSTFGALLSLLPLFAITLVVLRTVGGSWFSFAAGPFCYMRFGTMSFIVTAFLYINEFIPRHSLVVDFTWYNVGVTQWQLLGFMGMIICGGIYHILPRVMQKELPFPVLAKVNFFTFVLGVLLLAVPLVIGGVLQGLKLADANVAFADASAAALMFIRASTGGQLLILIGALCLLLNILVMTIQWKFGLVKVAVGAIKAPLPFEEVKP